MHNTNQYLLLCDHIEVDQSQKCLWTHTTQVAREVCQKNVVYIHTYLCDIKRSFLYSFIMFSWMLLIMSIAWLFFVLSLMPYDGLLYAHILVNAIQAPLLLYICVLGQKHVTFLLKKSCCYNEPPSANDWGDEMHYMNCNDY